MKEAVFRTETVEIKSNWLRFGPERERRYLSRFSMKPADLDAFVHRYYSLILEADLELIACVVDKEHMRLRYGAKAWYPPAAAFELLLQRGKTPKGRDYRENLRNHHKQLKQTGSRLDLLRSGQVGLRGLQEVSSDAGEEWEMQGLQNLPTYDWFRRIASKFRKGPDDRIQGFGVGKIPLLQRVQWKVPKK